MCVYISHAGNTILSCCARVDEQQQQQWRQQLERQPPPAAALPAQAAAALPPPPAAAGYEDVAGAAFGPLGRLFVSGVMYAELLGICCVYVVLEVGAARSRCAEVVGTLLGMRVCRQRQGSSRVHQLCASTHAEH